MKDSGALRFVAMSCLQILVAVAFGCQPGAIAAGERSMLSERTVTELPPCDRFVSVALLADGGEQSQMILRGEEVPCDDNKPLRKPDLSGAGDYPPDGPPYMPRNPAELQ